MKHFVVTLARGFGSGGKEIASALAHSLGIHCYENRILTLASRMSGVEEKVFVDNNERLPIANRLAQLTKTMRSIPRHEPFVSDEKLFDYQRQIILNLAASESCVIVGKCADWILRGNANVLSVYIEAPRQHCAARIMQQMSVSRETADRSIERTDKYRAAYYKHYTGGQSWTNPVNYDLTLNSERLGIDGCVEMIRHCLQVKFPIRLNGHPDP